MEKNEEIAVTEGVLTALNIAIGAFLAFASGIFILTQGAAIVPLTIAGGLFLVIATAMTAIGTYRIKRLESGEADELETLITKFDTGEADDGESGEADKLESLITELEGVTDDELETLTAEVDRLTADTETDPTAETNSEVETETTD